MFDYGVELGKQLEKDRWLRHLFGRKGENIVVVLKDGERIEGILKTIEFSRGMINIEVTGEHDWFINWRYVKYVQSEKFDV